MEVTSGESGSVFEVDRFDAAGELSDNKFYHAVAEIAGGPFPGLGPRATTTTLVSSTLWAEGDQNYYVGAVFMKISPSSSNYGESDYGGYPGALEVRYRDIGDGDAVFSPPDGGVIALEHINQVSGGGDQVSELLNSVGPGTENVCTSTDCPNFYYAIAEKAGTEQSNEFVDYFVFGIDGTDTGTPGDATFDFNSDDGAGFEQTSDNQEILYGHATANPEPNFYDGTIPTGPVTGGMEMVEEGYVSERGSVFKTIDESTVQFDMAHKLARAQWFLAAASSTSGDASTIVVLGEGDSETVSGVTVKVLEITEDVGACSAGTGSVSCTADMAGVSAVIMPNNAPTVSVATPAAYANLVVLDTDAVGFNTIVSVGGDRVNTVSKDLLSASPVDWASEKKVVREVVAGSKIVVAGAEAADTLGAAQDFVAQVKKV